jgi:excinuclease ABC subunit C
LCGRAAISVAVRAAIRPAVQARWQAKTRSSGRLVALQEALEMPEPPRRIECFDISHTMGEATVASCVVFGPEGAEKSRYRRFNIQGITAGDDYAAMHQALERRYRRIQNGEGCLPDVLLIDGGAGQVRQALDVLATLGVEGVCVVGVASPMGTASVACARWVAAAAAVAIGIYVALQPASWHVVER